MATDKKFTVVGTTVFNQQLKIRFANDLARIKTLVKKGHSDIELQLLPEAMTKRQAVFWLREQGFGKDSLATQDALDQVLMRNPEPKEPSHA